MACMMSADAGAHPASPTWREGGGGERGGRNGEGPRVKTRGGGRAHMRAFTAPQTRPIKCPDAPRPALAAGERAHKNAGIAPPNPKRGPLNAQARLAQPRKRERGHPQPVNTLP